MGEVCILGYRFLVSKRNVITFQGKEKYHNLHGGSVHCRFLLFKRNITIFQEEYFNFHGGSVYHSMGFYLQRDIITFQEKYYNFMRAVCTIKEKYHNFPREIL